jgi:hypothetical protein
MNRPFVATRAASLATWAARSVRTNGEIANTRLRGSSTPPPADLTSPADLKWFDVFKDEVTEEIRTALVQNYDLREAARGRGACQSRCRLISDR